MDQNRIYIEVHAYANLPTFESQGPTRAYEVPFDAATVMDNQCRYQPKQSKENPKRITSSSANERRPSISSQKEVQMPAAKNRVCLKTGQCF